MPPRAVFASRRTHLAFQFLSFIFEVAEQTIVQRKESPLPVLSHMSTFGKVACNVLKAELASAVSRFAGVRVIAVALPLYASSILLTFMRHRFRVRRAS